MPFQVKALRVASSIAILIGGFMLYLAGISVLGILAASRNHGMPYEELRQGISGVGQLGVGAVLYICAGRTFYR